MRGNPLGGHVGVGGCARPQAQRGPHSMAPQPAHGSAEHARCVRPKDMPQNEPITTDDARALSTLDIHYGMLLGCTGTDLRRTGWTVVSARLDFDPMALLFGQRSLVYLVVPEPRERGQGRSGVAIIAPELRTRVAPLLRERAP